MEPVENAVQLILAFQHAILQIALHFNKINYRNNNDVLSYSLSTNDVLFDKRIDMVFQLILLTYSIK